MGAADSKQKLGERVIAARKKLADDKKIQSERIKDIESKSPQTIKIIMKSIAASFKSCSPFLEPILLIAWQLDPEKCSKIILNTCKRVLNAPINRDEYEWFIKYVFPSSIWMFKNKKNRFMYEELIDIAKNMQQNIIDSMNSIYNHLEYHSAWKQILNIENQTIVSRQDDKKVGLLKELEMKQVDDTSDDLQSFIDSNLAVNILTTTAKNINQEFQNHINTFMSHFGDFKSGPIKKVDRCVSKLENDYQNEAYPKAAKLLDLIRCSVTFNTVDQLVAGYNGLMKHIDKNSNNIQLARVKNGFLDSKYSGGYRDIKVNVIFHSDINPGVSMICEIQLLLGQYLHEKKRIHKLYSIVRQELYFKMTVKEDIEQQTHSNANALQFMPVLNVEHGTHKLPYDIGKCSVDSDLGLLAVETDKRISCIDMKSKKIIFDHKCPSISGENYSYQMYSHSWIVFNGKKYLSCQTEMGIIKFFKFRKDNNSFVEAKGLGISLDWYPGVNHIYCCEFDKTFENIIMVIDGKKLEKRAVKSNKVLVSIKLEEKIGVPDGKALSLSNDGNWCVIGGGHRKSYFYLIEIDKKVQHKMYSKHLKDSISPVFVNGDHRFCVVGSGNGKLEVWDVKKRIAIKLVQLESKRSILCLTSTNNMLAVGSGDKKLTLFNTQNWEIVWSKRYQMKPRSVHLTDDSKFLTIAGNGGEKCLVLGIQ